MRKPRFDRVPHCYPVLETLGMAEVLCRNCVGRDMGGRTRRR